MWFLGHPAEGLLALLKVNMLAVYTLATGIASADVYALTKQPLLSMPVHSVPYTNLAATPFVCRFVRPIRWRAFAMVMLKIPLEERARTPGSCIFFQPHMF